ncbi:NAD-dependent epimerase/dehydratase family protein [Psychrobacillus sp. NEAU-3TGS]|uniref:NAD-dependent epimerase/dehydratase family protein n=1 Tax=Psychrobacillus sp. NEAU-3TGS TaxID=2995412 RepID=UPI00249765FC|nr:NAD-dependent epimerase/dehydratase family protein [Psychrobacillus sp. NEAU-3TGS]MDI2587544.1 NAD-dependent epimerase/dehydratase family protein [Psychrobacillus sp. NEAU-3TGS]
MRKALVLGGTRFFGVHLVEALLAKGFEVTIATRGNTQDPFSTRVNRIIVDRLNVVELKKQCGNETWDIIFDQICYSSQEAMDAIGVFQDKTKKYVFTSSKSVYDAGNGEVGYVEEDFDPWKHTIIQGPKEDFSYNEGKRQAEAVFFQKAPFPVVAVRFPIVLGLNDYTKRLHFHIEKIRNHEEIHLVNPEASIDFITEEEAGKFLAWIGLSEFTGPINALSNGKVKLSDLITTIEEKTQTSAIITSIPNETNVSPFNISASWLMDNEKARNLGFQFRDLEEWLPVLIEEILESN